MKKSGEWVVPFKGQNPSGCYDQNFLWRSGSVYIMDNHRAALWCWMQHIKAQMVHSIFHIDRHYDTLQSNMKTWLRRFPSKWDMNIDEYLTRSYNFDDDDATDHLLFRFDNYLSLHLHQSKKAISTCHFATHDDGDKPNFKGGFYPPPWELLGNLDYWIDDKQKPWILNIDLDYFFCDDGEDDNHQMLSDGYIDSVFESLRKVTEKGHVAVTTIAMSPEFCGGWDKSEQVLAIALAKLGIDFKLPIA
jgi:hypothetical protein